MLQGILIRITGIAGALVVLYSYYMFWVPMDVEMSYAIVRTRTAVPLNIVGNLMVTLYLYDRFIKVK